MIKRWALLAVVVLLGACATTAHITRLVRVTRTTYLPVPPELLLPCATTHNKNILTNGDLLQAYLDTRQALTVCNYQIHQISTLKAPPASTQ